MTPQDLSSWRRSRGLSQSGLANKLGVLQHKLSRWETGATALPDDLETQLEALNLAPKVNGYHFGGQRYPRFFDLDGKEVDYPANINAPDPDNYNANTDVIWLLSSPEAKGMNLWQILLDRDNRKYWQPTEVYYSFAMRRAVCIRPEQNAKYADVLDRATARLENFDNPT